MIYFSAFLVALGLTLALTPCMRRLALRFDVLDHPSSPIKTHRTPTPYLGGAAIYLGVLGAFLFLRLTTHFPTGTLTSLRGILAGATFIVAVGLADDFKRGGLAFQWKFFFQFLAALMLLTFDIRIKFIQPEWLSYILTVLWVVGITNAFNLMDIMDGLAASQALIAGLGFLLISLPTEEIYVNAAAVAVAGASLGFLPYNLSRRWKIFMGDAGSLLLGFLMAALSLGTTYTRVSETGVLAPLLILGLPLYDTFFVMLMRVMQGKSPFVGSKDHLALKLGALGMSRGRVVLVFGAVAAVFSLAAYAVAHQPFYVSIFLFALIPMAGLYATARLRKVHVP
ncbi:MAG: MraY family glycosyltransferase [Elusimicrobiota bacterium]|jgi:UDP-GlcNAc:undecaprenyl-phosphate/decaprenyl-phosphate GlcNAc-1-phosphate transferase